MAPEPMAAQNAAAAAWQALGSVALAGILTGMDYWTFIWGAVGALMALRAQEPQGRLRAVIGVIGVGMFALSATWFVLDLLPLLSKSVGMDTPELGKGRSFIAWLVGYFGKSHLLPLGAQAITALFGKFLGEKAKETEQ